MAGIGIIANPHSKLNKRNPERQQLLSYIAGEKGFLEITNNIEDINRVARDFLAKNIEILAINGGDGTISRTLTAFIKVYGNHPLPTIALLRGGTMNMLADNLKVKGTPESLLYQLIKSHSSGNFSQRTKLRALCVDDNYGFLFSNGTGARLLEEFYKVKGNALRVVVFLAQIMLSYFVDGYLFKAILRRSLFDLRAADSPPIQVPACTIMCGTVDRLPMRIPFFNVMTTPDRFHCIGLTLSEEELVKVLPFFFVRPNHYLRKLLHLYSTTLEVHSPTSDEGIYTLDGEVYHPTTKDVKISLGPVLEFIAP